MRKSCVFYAEWADQIISLPPEMAGQLAKAMLMYALYDEEIEVDDCALKAMLVPIKKRLDADAEAWEETKRLRSEGGKKGMARRWHNGVITQNNSLITDDKSVKESITPITVNVNDNVNVIKEKKYKKKKNTFHNFQEREYDFSELKAGVEDV